MNGEFIEDDLYIITKETIDILLKQENPDELIGQYIFYYYTAKWQKTDTAKASTSYTAKAMGRSEEKIRANKKRLLSLKMIEEVVRKDDQGKILGWYIKPKFIKWKNHPTEKPEGGKNHRVDLTTTNALKTNSLNALKTNKEILGFSSFWEKYPRKIAKKEAIKAWQKVELTPELLEKILSSLDDHIQSEQWKKDGGQFIPHASTWLNQERWNDEIKKRRVIY